MQKAIEPVEAIIFDMDGVLFDTEALGIEMTMQAAMEAGLSIAIEVVKGTLGLTGEATKSHYISHYGSDFDYDAFSNRWKELMQQSIQKNGVPVKKGARELLGEIKKRHIKTGIATSSKRPIVNLYLQSAGLESTFDAIITGDMVANSKPNPEIYLKAAQGLGARPEACMGIEDSIHGIKALRAAGMVSVMVPDIIAYSPDLAPYIDYVCASLKDIIDIIRL